MNYSGNFAKIYNHLFNNIPYNETNIECNDNKMLYEILNVQLTINIPFIDNVPYVNMYSNTDTRALPIGFTLAEFLTILTPNSNVSHLARFNKNILNYTEFGNISYHYGTHIWYQLPDVLDLLKTDKNTRQACANIWEHGELFNKHKSCNVFLQFIIRNDRLNLVVISRSSDFLTGLLIDSFHWQMLLIAFWYDLKNTYGDLLPGSVIYKITSLHVYEKDKFVFDDTKWLSYEPEYSHYLSMHSSFTNLFEIANNVRTCENVDDLLKLYKFDSSQLQVIENLRYVYKNRKYNLSR